MYIYTHIDPLSFIAFILYYAISAILSLTYDTF